MGPLAGVRALLFDYGNTLIRFGQREESIVMDAFHRVLLPLGGPEDRDEFRARVVAITSELIDRATTTGREVRRDEKVVRVLEAFDLATDPETVEPILETIGDAFVRSIESASDLVPRLTRLRERYALGLLSNYFLAEPIHASLRKIGIEDLLEPRVVSADIGWCKPHPNAFEPAIRGLGLPPEQILMVGDNLTADVGGGSAVGLRTAHIREHLGTALPYGRPEGDGAKPDVSVDSLAELERLLLGA
jgi:putative hydrolase of the HAD superfamily